MVCLAKAAFSKSVLITNCGVHNAFPFVELPQVCECDMTDLCSIVQPDGQIPRQLKGFMQFLYLLDFAFQRLHPFKGEVRAAVDWDEVEITDQ